MSNLPDSDESRVSRVRREVFLLDSEEFEGVEGGSGRGRFTNIHAGVAGEISMVTEFGVEDPRQ